MCFKRKNKEAPKLSHIEEVSNDRNRVPQANRNMVGGNTSFKGYDGPSLKK